MHQRIFRFHNQRPEWSDLNLSMHCSPDVCIPLVISTALTMHTFIYLQLSALRGSVT